MKAAYSLISLLLQVWYSPSGIYIAYSYVVY
jgi:hypothetical protein